MIIKCPDQLPQKKDSWYVFLAGPIQGAPEWQNEAPKLISHANCTFLSPRRDSYEGFNWEEQVAWETIGLKISDVILFWIPEAIEKIEGRDYAQTTRTELGEYLALGKKVILGIHQDFPGRRYLATKAAQYGVNEVHTSLEECIKELEEFMSQMRSRENKIWFTSDTHFGSERTLELSKRPWSSVKDMDWGMIQKWNDKVKPGDKVYHLGDFGDLWPLQYLNGNITLILGNYEKKASEEYINELLTDPRIKVESSDEVNEFFLAHEPTIGLKKMKAESDKDWLLFGHIHGRQKVKKFGIDVGVDANNYEPMSLDDVRFYINAIDKGYYDDDVWCQ